MPLRLAKKVHASWIQYFRRTQFCLWKREILPRLTSTSTRSTPHTTLRSCCEISTESFNKPCADCAERIRLSSHGSNDDRQYWALSDVHNWKAHFKRSQDTRDTQLGFDKSEVITRRATFGRGKAPGCYADGEHATSWIIVRGCTQWCLSRRDLANGGSNHRASVACRFRMRLRLDLGNEGFLLCQ